MFGVFPHYVKNRKVPMVRGFDDIFYAPHSRHTEVRKEDIEKCEDLTILAESDEAGIYAVCSEDSKHFFITGHSEYDRFTLSEEYFRDKSKGLNIDVPYNYFPYNDPSQPPHFNWRCHANLLFSNWINYCVYQETPYNIDEIS